MALSPLVRRQRRHDPGRVLVDLAVMAASGGGYSSDLAPLRDQPALLGRWHHSPRRGDLLTPPSTPTSTYRHCPGGGQSQGVGGGRGTRSVHLGFRCQPDQCAFRETERHADLQISFGLHPLPGLLGRDERGVGGDAATGPGGANTAADHIALLDEALAQLPVKCRPTTPRAVSTCWCGPTSTAGATHGFVDAIVAKGMEFSIGFDVTEAVRLAIFGSPRTPGPSRWARTWNLVRVPGWPRSPGSWTCPPGRRALGPYRSEQPHPGAQCTIFEAEGWRHRCSSPTAPTPTSSPSRSTITAATPMSRTASKPPKPWAWIISPVTTSRPTPPG